MRRIIFAALAVILIGLAGLTFAGDAVKPVVIDVRTQAEWDAGHLDGAILIPYDQITDRIGAVVKDKSQTIYVHCRTGRRAQVAKETLERLGYTNVVNLGTLEEAAKALKMRIVK